jgi:hypothetical protein
MIFPLGGTDASSFELSFAQGADNAVPTQLTFDGSINNSSFFNPAQVSFWFDWTDADGTAHTSQPKAFSLTPIMGTLTSHSGETFSRDFLIPDSPAEVSVHLSNETAVSIDGRPVFVTGTLATVPEPATGLFLMVASMVLPSLRLLRVVARK